MALFKEKKKKGVAMTSPPEEPETPEEIKHIEELSDDKIIPAIQEQAKKEIMNKAMEDIEEQPKVVYQQVPVCMSQIEINNLVIENHNMLKYIVSKIEEEAD